MGLDRTDLVTATQPPFGKTKVTIDTPNLLDQTVVEEVPGSPENYAPLPYGTPHPDNATTGLNLKLTWQGPVKAANNQIRILRVYTTGDGPPDNWYNFALKYSGESNAGPIFIRTYEALRTTYAPLPKGQPLTAIIGLVVTAPGSGYTAAPTVVFTGGGGSGATANAILDLKAGTVVGLELTHEGTGYTSAPTISFVGGGGTGAAATATIQPTNALLVKEETTRLEQENPQHASLFIKVHRVYETLPGPWASTTKIDDDGQPLTTSRRRNLVSDIVTTETATGGVYSKFTKGEGDSVVAEEIVESRPIPGPHEVERETTEEYGGGILDVTSTIDEPGQMPDEGYLVVDSRVKKRGGDKLEQKITRELSVSEDPTLELIKGGSGYTSAPAVSFAGGIGSGATATAQMGRTLLSLAITSGGSGYTSPPVIVLDGGGGAGGAAVAVLGYGISTIDVLDGGSGYTSAPAVSLTGGGGSGATATAVLGFAVASIAVTARGTGFVSAPAVLITGGGGNGASANAIMGFSVDSVTVDAAGSGYSTPPTIVFTGDGSGAAATAVLAFNVASATVTSIGSGYTSAPAIAFSGGGGAGATGTAVLGYGVLSVPLAAAGSGYTTAPTVAFSGGGGGSGAAATAVLGKTVASGTVGTPGTGYVFPPSVAFSGGGGFGATATARLKVISVTIAAGGSGYTVGDILTVQGGTQTVPATLLVTSVDGGGAVTGVSIDVAGTYSLTPDNSVAITGGTGADDATFDLDFGVGAITITNAGSGYTSTPGMTLTGGGGSGAAGTFTLSATSTIKSFTVTAAGSGYTSPPTVSLSGGGGTGGAAGTPTLTTTGTLKSITITAGGSGYSTAPTIAITGGGGTGAAATAVLGTNGTVVGITLTNGGGGYTTAPTMSFSGGGGTGAAATALLGTALSLSRVDVVSGGADFTSAPTIAFSGGGGTGATASATLETAGRVKSINVTAPGTDYTDSPTVNFTGGAGSGASARANVSSSGMVVGAIVALPGLGYTSAPTASFVGGGGSGAAATVNLSTTYHVAGLTLTALGSYTLAPTVVFTGGGGAGAEAVYSIGGKEWPTLIGCITDPKYGIVVDIIRKVVRANTRHPGRGNYVDLDVHDKWRTIQITSKVDLSTLPAPVVWGGSRRINLPSVLLSVECLWTDSSVAGAAETSYEERAAGNHPVLVINSDAEVAASANTSVIVSGRIIVRTVDGFNGWARAEFTRQFFFGPPPLGAVPLPTKIQGVSGTAIATSFTTQQTSSVGFGRNASSGSRHVQQDVAHIQNVLTAGFAVIGGAHTPHPIGAYAEGTAKNGDLLTRALIGYGIPGTMVVSMPISTPANLYPGQVIILDAEPEEWRFGLWILETIRITIP